MSASTSPALPYNTVLLFGPPGSGKGLWGKILGMMPGFYHLSTGEMFRQLDTESEAGIKVMEFMRQGELVPDDMVFDLWQQHMQKVIWVGAFRPTKDIVILDGLPRTPRQAERLKPLTQIKVILLLDCNDREILFERLRKRAVMEHRIDDANDRTIRHRFKIYDNQTRKTLAHYEENLLERIDVAAPPVRILNSLCAALDRRLSNASRAR